MRPSGANPAPDDFTISTVRAVRGFTPRIATERKTRMHARCLGCSGVARHGAVPTPNLAVLPAGRYRSPRTEAGTAARQTVRKSEEVVSERRRGPKKRNSPVHATRQHSRRAKCRRAGPPPASDQPGATWQTSIPGPDRTAHALRFKVPRQGRASAPLSPPRSGAVPAQCTSSGARLEAGLVRAPLPAPGRDTCRRGARLISSVLGAARRRARLILTVVVCGQARSRPLVSVVSNRGALPPRQAEEMPAAARPGERRRRASVEAGARPAPAPGGP
jgi:hypothetical protein